LKKKIKKRKTKEEINLGKKKEKKTCKTQKYMGGKTKTMWGGGGPKKKGK
jgi:hypothetical protein